MLALKTGHQLTWGDLQFIEVPMVAKQTLKANHGVKVGGDSIINAKDHNLPDERSRSFDPYSEIDFKLDNGNVFLVNSNTSNPVFTRLEITEHNTAIWEITHSQTAMFENSIDATMRHIPVPKVHGVLRQEAKDAPAKNEEQKPQKEKLITIAKIARKLRQIEGGTRYEEARYFASKIGWEGICSLVEIGHPENDPNLMPSRYMILPGASDEILKKKGNLNNFPHPVHANSPKQMSVFNLKRFLILGGYLKGEIPYWQSPELLTDEELDKFKKDGGLDNTEISSLNGYAEMDSEVESALNRYLGDYTFEEPNGGSSYTIKSGDTLSDIAEKHGYSNWQVLWHHNRHVIDNPDLVFPGTEIDLPDLRNDELEPWFHEFDNGADVWQGSSHYHFPAEYLSLSMVDRKGDQVNIDLKSQFQGYTKDSKIFYNLAVEKSDQVEVLMPVGDNIGAGFKQDEFENEHLELKSFEKVLYGESDSSNSCEFDLEDDENLTPDDVELAQ